MVYYFNRFVAAWCLPSAYAKFSKALVCLGLGVFINCLFGNHFFFTIRAMLVRVIPQLKW